MMYKTPFLFLVLVLFSRCTTNHSSTPAVQFPALAEAGNAADTLIVREELSSHFSACNAHVEGSITVYDHNKGVWILSDSADAYKETLPASTFKIINLLIALEEGVIRDENEIMRWPGKTDTTLYGYRPDIYRDMTVKEAFEVSAVWAFLDLANRIGKDKYAQYLRASGYGNGNIREAGEDFWNFGTFGISPVNQVQFMKNVYEGKTPFSKRNIDILKRVMLTETADAYSISAKTGWTREGGINVGWWVGYVEREQQLYFFATRLMQDRRYNSPDFAPCRKEITKAVLREMQLIP
ncbi:beta-lactamase [Flammeovirgaceae bacterium 311]|nr:beta-lactamase [Flammeovirgaceae bacterium 311]